MIFPRTMTLSRTLTQLLILTVAFTLALSINYLYAAVWSGPPAGVPPANNVNAPIHVGTAPQIKDGILEVGNSLNTAANYGLITKGRVRIDVGGIQFSDGSYQDRAAAGGQGLSFNKYMHVREEEPNGIDPAGVAVGSYGTRVLNTVVTNTITGASLAANRITLPTGSYYIDAFASSYSGGRHRAQLFNVTLGITAVMGTSGYGAASSNEDVTESFIKGVFAVTGASEIFDIRHRSVDGGRGGIADAFGTVEYYTPVEIWKLD